MSELRDKAIIREAAGLADEAQYLERLSRDHPMISGEAAVAKRAARRAEQLAEKQLGAEDEPLRTDASATSRGDGELRRRAVTDEDALAELCRREALPAAA